MAGTGTDETTAPGSISKAERKDRQIVARCTFAEYVLVRMQFHRFDCMPVSYDKSQDSSHRP